MNKKTKLSQEKAKQIYIEEQKQEITPNKNDLKPQYRYTSNNPQLDYVTKHIATMSKNAQQTDEGNYNTKGFEKNDNFILTLYQNPTQYNNFKDFDYLAKLNKEDLQNNLEDIWKSIDQTTAKFLDVLIIKQTEAGFKDATTMLSLKEYATLLNGGNEPTRSQINKARDKANKSMTALSYLGYTFKQGKHNYLDIMLYGGSKGLKNGKIYFKFNTDFLRVNFLLDNKHLAIFPIKLLSINENTHPNSYLIGRKLWSLRRNNKGKPYREKTFTVKNLYEYAVTLPRYNKVNYDITSRIIKPFERDLDAIADTGLLKWNYDKEYTDKTADKNYTLTFEDWLNAKIEIEWLDEFNNQDNSITAGREKQKKLAKKNK